MKKCTKCGEVKPLVEFHSDITKIDGRQATCKPCRIATSKEYRIKNAEKVRLSASSRSAKYYLNNAEKILSRTSEYQRKHPEKSCTKAAKRRAAKLQRTPTWADHEKIKAIYAYAKFIEELGIKCHVDHIVPLQGKRVCGLHVHYNLRVVTDVENIKKHNKVDDPFAPSEIDMPGFQQYLKENNQCALT